MTRHERGRGFARAAVAFCLLASTAAAAIEELSYEARASRRIVDAMVSGRTREALGEAEGAVKSSPTSALLHRRLAQARLTEALETDREFGVAAEDADFARWLMIGVNRVLSPEAAERETKYPEKFERFVAAASGPLVSGFSQKADRQVAGSGDLLQSRSRLLSSSQEALKQARALGDATTELELTELWTRVLVHAWKREGQDIARTEPRDGPDGARSKARAAAIAQSLTAFQDITEEATVERALSLAKSRPADPRALAGAADVIDLLGALTGKPDPLRAHLLGVLNGRPSSRPAQLAAPNNPAGPDPVHELYARSRDPLNAEAPASPTAAAIRLYGSALHEDPRGTLPHLRMRLYLLRAAFEPGDARRLLEELRRQQPRNSAVAFERARAGFLIEGLPVEGLAECRKAERSNDYDRSYLVAVPSPLRNALAFNRALSRTIEKAWPSYDWLFVTLKEALRAEPQPQARMELLLLRLRLASLLCGAPDYGDRARGIEEKTRALNDLLALRDGVSPEQRLAVGLQMDEHQRTFAQFPRRRSMLVLTAKGLHESHYPKTAGSTMLQGYFMMVTPQVVTYAHGFIRD